MLEQEVELNGVVSTIETYDPVFVVDNVLASCVLVLVKTELGCPAECLVELFLVFYEHD